MKQEHFDLYLAGHFSLQPLKIDPLTKEILEGDLVSLSQGFDNGQIVNGIPRFVPVTNYADSFGFQWNQFKATQLDSVNGLSLTADRFKKTAKWRPEDLAGKTVLEVGSGAGRFTEILLGLGAKVVSFDYSNAVETNYANNKGKGDLFLFQGDLYHIPFNDNYFDYVFCHGVLQHTPDPVMAYKAIFKKLKAGGIISIDYYRKSWIPNAWSTPKYIWRPLTSGMQQDKLLKIIKAYMPFFLPIDTLIRRIPKFGPVILGLIPIPCWNYIDSGLSDKQRLEWAIMDTFDALSPKYDFPKTLDEVREMVQSPENGFEEVFYGGNGVVANVVKMVDDKK